MFSNNFTNDARGAVSRLARTAVIVLAVAFAATSVGGCSLLSSQMDKAAQEAGKIVKLYCDNVSDASVRLQIREAVNKYASPNTVAVTCASGATMNTAPTGTNTPTPPPATPPATASGN